MMNSNLLYACSHCFKRFLFEDLTIDNHYCKRCYEKTRRYCSHCFKRFSPRDFYQNYCIVCKTRSKKYGKPSLCKFCNKKPTFGDRKCKKCYKKSTLLKKCNCCHMEYEQRKSENVNLSLCWRCESTMQDPKSMEDSLENISVYSIFSPVSPLPQSPQAFKQIIKKNNSIEEEEKNVALKSPEKLGQYEATRDLASKINTLEEYLLQKDQELIGKETEIILLKSECERIREIEEKMEILRKLDEQNKEIENNKKKKKNQNKKTYALPTFKFFEGNQHS